MDLSLPGMDGWEATRVLKADERTKHIPVVALTGHALAGASEGAKKAGCDSFVTKPCLPDDLVVEVRRMLDAVKTSVSDRDRHGEGSEGKARQSARKSAAAPAPRAGGDAAQHAEPRRGDSRKARADAGAAGRAARAGPAG